MLELAVNVKVLFSFFLALPFFTSCNKIGDQVAEPDMIDDSEKLVVFEGKVTVVNVWATWCGTCVKEIPALNEIEEKYRDDPRIQFIAFADESRDKVEKSLERFPFHYRQVANAGSYISSLKTRWVKTYPQNLIINEHREIVFERTDDIKDLKKDLINAIETALHSLK
ncbi:MAG: redoxin family protein [Bacteroidetes bacterium]|nr:redoxin family protein [Bacteroidota bacterium]